MNLAFEPFFFAIVCCEGSYLYTTKIPAADLSRTVQEMLLMRT